MVGAGEAEDEAERALEGQRIAASLFGRHVVLHTASVVMDLFDRHLLGHPAVEFGDEEIKAGADRAFDALFDFYQLCGRKFL